jgi:DNA repair photolyase
MKIGITERGDGGLSIVTVLSALASSLVDGAIVVTKAAHKLLSYDLPANVIVHCTITGWGGTWLEPGVAWTSETLAAYHTLVAKYGGERVVLRVDPILPTKEGMNEARRITQQAEGRIRVSFLDGYPHVRARMSPYRELPWEGLHAPLELRKTYLSELPAHTEVCGEPGLPCTGCVSKRDLDAMGLAGGHLGGRQRSSCCCLAEKTELLSVRGQCPHGCLYCYWK